MQHILDNNDLIDEISLAKLLHLCTTHMIIKEELLDNFFQKVFNFKIKPVDSEVN